MSSKFAIIVAGGSGSRMKSKTPKQFLSLSEKPVICHSIDKFLDADPATQVIVVIPREHESLWKVIAKEFFPKFPPLIAYGGETRFESVQNGLALIQDKKSVVAIHDAVRPLVSQKVIQTSFDVAELRGSAITVVPLKDSIRQRVDGGGSRSVDRGDYFAVQTPQTFKYSMLKLAYGQKYHPSFTDDASVVERMGTQVHLIEGSYENFKITTPEDLKLAEMYM